MVVAFALIVLVAVSVYYRILWGSVEGFVQSIDYCNKLFCDFVVYYYEMGRTILVTKVPAPGFYYSPLFALSMALFGAFELKNALLLWGVVMIVTTVGLGVLSYRTAPPESRVTIAGFILLFVTSFPILHNFKWGQVSVLLVLLVVGSLVAYERKHVVPSALLLALAVSIKYFPVIFIIYFIIHRDWKFVLTFVLGSVAFLFIIPAIVIGPSETLEFLRRLVVESGEAQRAAGGPNSQSLKNVLARLLPVSGGAVESSRIAFAAVAYFLLQANLVLVFLLRKITRHEGLTICFMLLFLSTPLFVGTSWPHYLVYLPFCQVLAFEMLRQTYEPSRVRRRIMAGLLVVSVVLASVMMFDLVGSWERYNGAGMLLWSDIALLAFLYLHAVPKILPPVPPSKLAAAK
jgi:alpha-1,2-mannosyltransferase